MWIILTIFFVQFADKAGSNVVCLSPTAIEMRETRGIAIDSLDYEVSPIYLDSLRALGATVMHTSRWINGATVEASNETIKTIEQCSFIDTICLTRTNKDDFTIPSVSLSKRTVKKEVVTDELGSNGQINQLNLPP